MDEIDEKALKERIMLVQALPEDAVKRLLSAEGALKNAGLTARIEQLYRPGKSRGV